MNDLSAPSIDRHELLSRVENDEELAREILTIFQADLPGYRDSLRIAVESGSAEDVRRTAHAFKGMLANLAAGTASTLAAKLEQLASTGELQQFAPVCAEFQHELDRVVRDVESFLAGATK